jgi:wyosine [tRNA(Phe)-imidazoG37] synthetase (radical SAM superfamily)
MIRIINTRFPELKVSVITNSTMLCDKNVRRNIIDADLIVPSLDCYDDESYRKINRPHSSLKFKDLFEGLINLRSEFKGLFRLEIMLVKDLNDDEESVLKISELVRQLQPFDIDINIPSRPPAEKWVLKPSDDALKLFFHNRSNSIGKFKQIKT